MEKRNLQDLQMGLVEANFVCINKQEKQLWLDRGFEEQRDFPIFLEEPTEEETIMLGVPQTITQFGTENLLEAKVLKECACIGTYGMGGPGFFGLLCSTKQGTFWLTLTIWGAGQYILLDDNVITCHSSYEKEYHPWLHRQEQEFHSIVQGAVLKSIHLSDEECQILMESPNSTLHRMTIYKYSKKLPPMGNGAQRKNAFEAGTLSDYLLLTHEGTELQV